MDPVIPSLFICVWLGLLAWSGWKVLRRNPGESPSISYVRYTQIMSALAAIFFVLRNIINLLESPPIEVIYLGALFTDLANAATVGWAITMLFFLMRSAASISHFYTQKAWVELLLSHLSFVIWPIFLVYSLFSGTMSFFCLYDNQDRWAAYRYLATGIIMTIITPPAVSFVEWIARVFLQSAEQSKSSAKTVHEMIIYRRFGRLTGLVGLVLCSLEYYFFYVKLEANEDKCNMAYSLGAIFLEAATVLLIGTALTFVSGSRSNNAKVSPSVSYSFQGRVSSSPCKQSLDSVEKKSPIRSTGRPSS